MLLICRCIYTVHNIQHSIITLYCTIIKNILLWSRHVLLNFVRKHSNYIGAIYIHSTAIDRNRKNQPCVLTIKYHADMRPSRSTKLIQLTKLKVTFIAENIYCLLPQTNYKEWFYVFNKAHSYNLCHYIVSMFDVIMMMWLSGSRDKY